MWVPATIPEMNGDTSLIRTLLAIPSMSVRVVPLYLRHKGNMHFTVHIYRRFIEMLAIVIRYVTLLFSDVLD